LFFSWPVHCVLFYSASSPKALLMTGRCFGSQVVQCCKTNSI
jgi:hypothetical protein